ncbi:MAG: putative toxin-antitoxin system toxin component, PIN family [Planctomycetaceae bacterium]
MRILFDTNILARAVMGPAGPAGEVLRLVVPPHVMVLSPFLVSEVSRVLRYERMRRLHQMSDAEIDHALEELESAAEMIADVQLLPSAVVAADPDDDPVLAAAVEGQADVICTRDRHFQHADVQVWCHDRGLQVMDDLELLELLRNMNASG